jgi:hypothetical protein
MAQLDRPEARAIPSEEPAPSVPEAAAFPTSPHETLTLRQLRSRLYRGWALVSASTLITFGLAVGYLAWSTPLYTAEMAIAPPMQNYSDRAAGALSGGLGLLAGLAPGGNSGTNAAFLRYEKMMTSREVATRLVRDHQALQLIFPERWDAARHDWKPPRGIAARLKATVNHLFGHTVDTTPDITDLRDFIGKHLSVEVPAADMALEAPPAIRYVTFTFRDPGLATTFLIWLHQETDGVIREAELNRTRHMIDYLDDRLRRTTEVDERASLAQLLLDQERAEMLLTTGLDYSAEVLDMPGTPREPSSPKIALTLILGLLTGLFLGSLIAISRSAPSATSKPATHRSHAGHTFRWFQ